MDFGNDAIGIDCNDADESNQMPVEGSVCVYSLSLLCDVLMKAPWCLFGSPAHWHVLSLVGHLIVQALTVSTQLSLFKSSQLVIVALWLQYPSVGVCYRQLVVSYHTQMVLSNSLVCSQIIGLIDST